MSDLENTKLPPFTPQLSTAQRCNNINPYKIGFKPAEIAQVSSFFNFFTLHYCICWLNEPLTKQLTGSPAYTQKELNSIRFSGSLRPDAIIFRPPSSIFIVEFANQLSSKTLGQILHYKFLYNRYFPGDYNTHMIIDFKTPSHHVIPHLIEHDILPTITIDSITNNFESPEYLLCIIKRGAIDLRTLTNDFFLEYDNHFQVAKPFNIPLT